jgi:hypothetical protein
MTVLDILVFGPKMPQWQIASPLEGKTTLTVLDAYRTDLSALRSSGNASLSWQYLLHHTTTPSGRQLSSCHESFVHIRDSEKLDEEKARRAWTNLVGLLRDECRSRSQRLFLKKLGEHQLQSSDNAAELWSKPALVPECWVNIQSLMVSSKKNAEERKRTPFRVDLFLRAENYTHGADTPLTAVVEIDAPYHFRDEEAIILTTAKSRYCMRQGWRYFRFQAAEIDQLSPQDLYWETEPHGPDDIAF